METRVTEDFFTLALNPNTGYYRVTGNYLTYGIAGAMLMDLTLAGRIIISGNTITVGTASHTGIPVYDRMLEQIEASSRERNIKYWLRRFSMKTSWYRKGCQEMLTAQGVLRRERKRFLGIGYNLFFPSGSSRLQKLVFRIKDLILYNKEPEPHEAMLLGLIFACRMHRTLAAQSHERRKIRKALVKYIHSNPVAEGVQKTVMEMQAALTASIAAAVIMSSTSSSSH